MFNFANFAQTLAANRWTDLIENDFHSQCQSALNKYEIILSCKFYYKIRGLGEKRVVQLFYDFRRAVIVIGGNELFKEG